MFNRGMVASISLAIALVVGILGGCSAERKKALESENSLKFHHFDHGGHKYVWIQSSGMTLHRGDCPCDE